MKSNWHQAFCWPTLSPKHTHANFGQSSMNFWASGRLRFKHSFWISHVLGQPFMREAERVPSFFHLVSLQFFHGHLCPIQFGPSCFWICIEHASCCISLPFFGPEFLPLGTCLVGFLYVSFCHSCRQDILGMQVHAESVPIFWLRTFPFPFGRAFASLGLLQANMEQCPKPDPAQKLHGFLE